MKDKIIAALKNKYPNLGLSAKVLDGVASIIEATTTDETLETVVNGVEPLLKSFQAEADTRVASAIAKAKLEGVKPPKTTDPNTQQGPNPTDDTPEWVKALQGTIQGMASEIQTLKGNKVLGDRKAILEDKLKDAAPAFKSKILKDFARMNFENDDTFNEYLTETEADLGVFTQEIANQGLSGIGKPAIPTQAPTSAAVDSDIKAWAEKDKPITK